jgi:hypothetical protein
MNKHGSLPRERIGLLPALTEAGTGLGDHRPLAGSAAADYSAGCRTDPNSAAPDQQRLRTGRGMRPPLRVRNGARAARPRARDVTARGGRSPTALLLYVRTRHHADAPAAAQRDRYRTHPVARAPLPSPRAGKGFDQRPTSTSSEPRPRPRGRPAPALAGNDEWTHQPASVPAPPPAAGHGRRSARTS